MWNIIVEKPMQKIYSLQKSSFTNIDFEIIFLHVCRPTLQHTILYTWDTSFFVTFQPTMMTSSNGIFFRVTGHLCGEFTGPRWIPHTKASDAELWCFLWSASE